MTDPDRPDHPDDAKLDDSHAAMTESARRRQRVGIVEMGLVAAAAILISVSTMFGAWNTFELRKLQQDEVETRRLILLGTECLVDQLLHHRYLTGLAHRANADHEGYSYPIPPDEELPPVEGKLERSCAIFISTTTTSRP